MSTGGGKGCRGKGSIENSRTNLPFPVKPLPPYSRKHRGNPYRWKRGLKSIYREEVTALGFLRTTGEKERESVLKGTVIWSLMKKKLLNSTSLSRLRS